MENAVAIAQVLGPLYFVAAIAIFTKPEALDKMVDEIEENPAQCFLWGFLTLAFGLIILALYDAWVADWTVLITIFGWLGVLKGVILMLSPGIAIGLSRIFVSTPARMKVWAIGPLALGVFLCVKGFGLA
jgi:hypothetical protein